MKSKCPSCGSMEEITRWPFCCGGCRNKNFSALVRLQAESIKNWEATCTPRRTEPERRRFSESIERGLRKLNL